MQRVERLVGFNSEMIWRPLEIIGQGPQMAEQRAPEFFAIKHETWTILVGKTNAAKRTDLWKHHFKKIPAKT